MSRFAAHYEKLDSNTVRSRPLWDGRTVTMREAFGLLAEDSDFRAELIEALQSASFRAYFWEIPGVTESTSNRPFEYVLTNAPAFQKVASEPEAFREHFPKDSDQDGVVTFQNLSRDATLVVPCPLGGTTDYAHLAAFLRSAPLEQRHALFQAVGRAALQRLSSQPSWLSTAGLGVYWLHVRVDARPKYYRHRPYKEAPSPGRYSR